jgi:type VI secretion system secreted protein Hcp
MAIDIFIKIGDIKGESTDAQHKDEIQVLAWNWGMSQSGTTHQGSGGGAGKVSFQDLSFSHSVDKASPILMLACASGQHQPEATLTVRKTGARPFEYLKIIMSDVIVASVTTGGSASEGRLSETVSLNFAKVKVTDTPQKPDGSADTPITFDWDITRNVRIS